MNDDHIGAYASSTAFFTFLSLFPMIMALLSVLPYTHLTQNQVLDVVSSFLPASMYSIIEEIVSDLYSASMAVLPVTLIITLWSAAKGTLALLRGLNVIYEVEERRNYFILRLRATIYTVAFLCMILLLLVGVVFAYRIRDLAVARFPNIRIVFEYLVSVRFIFVIMLLTAIFTAVFTYLPNVKNRFHWELPGAFFTACSWYFISWAFSVYINHFSLTTTYGSLTTVVIAMIWMYAIFYMILLGAGFNVFLFEAFQTFGARRRERRKERKNEKS